MLQSIVITVNRNITAWRNIFADGNIYYMKMTKTRIKQLCDKAGIETAYQLQKAASLPPSTAARLFKDEVESISLRMMDALCNALECEPGDLLVRVEEAKPTRKARK